MLMTKTYYSYKAKLGLLKILDSPTIAYYRAQIAINSPPLIFAQVRFIWTIAI